MELEEFHLYKRMGRLGFGKGRFPYHAWLSGGALLVHRAMREGEVVDVVNVLEDRNNNAR
jgi:hypothetical protein